MNYLVGDIGNTFIKIALLNKKLSIRKIFVLKNDVFDKKKKREKFLKNIIQKKINKKILFSSVNPEKFLILKNYFKQKSYSVHEIKKFNLKKLIRLNIKNPGQVGSDRIANAIGSFHNYRMNTIVIDFGTATTFDIIKIPGVYDGGVIAPGIEMSLKNLYEKTALLPSINLKNKINNYGKNTVDAINAGFLWGYQGLVNNIIKQIQLKSRKKFKIVLTGGYSKIFKKFINQKTIINKNITIEGIIKVYKFFLK